VARESNAALKPRPHKIGQTPMNIQGHVHNGMVVLDQPSPLPKGTRARIEPLASPPEDFWHCQTLDELARQQGIAPASADGLLGGWSKEELDDGFEEAARYEE
jgi:hypothetical protein